MNLSLNEAIHMKLTKETTMSFEYSVGIDGQWCCVVKFRDRTAILFGPTKSDVHAIKEALIAENWNGLGEAA